MQDSVAKKVSFKMSRRGGGASPLILYFFQNSEHKYLLENINVFAFKHIVIHNLLFVLFCFFPVSGHCLVAA